MAEQVRAEKALDDLAAEERRSEASSRESDKKAAARETAMTAREERVAKLEQEAQAHLDRALTIKKDADDRWRKFTA